MSITGSDLVSQLETRIAAKVGPQRFNVWFRNATQFQVADGYLKIGVPNMFIGGWIENHFADVLHEAIREIVGQDLRLMFTIDPNLSRHLKKRQLDSQVNFVSNNPERVAREHRKTGMNTEPRVLRGQLADFEVGPSNQLAYSCAQAVAEHPGRQHNPLFIHGACGLGKTHLLQGIFNLLQQKHAGLQVLFLTGEEFTNHFVYAIKSNNRDAFRHRFRSVDVLLLDDVHFLANKKATQEEFLHTFNAIDAAGKQLVMVSDAHPKLIGNFSDSLTSRFVAGMVVKIEPPGFDERVRILQRRGTAMKQEIPVAVLEYVASKVTSNVRELEGALLKLAAFARISHQPITLALAQQALGDHLHKTAPIIKLSDIESVTSIFFGLSPGDLHTSRKTRNISLARGVAMLLARNHTTMSFPEIARFLGKNHSTVILACRRLNKTLTSDSEVRWSTPGGDRRMNLRQIISELEEQLGLKSANGYHQALLNPPAARMGLDLARPSRESPAHRLAPVISAAAPLLPTT
ncbi:MAG: Chromosomal replication initiator protein DnaA [Phycisphaerae bacterium]|nr:Chromosomal replication initiator protein DnaA [Phycisphaerae bacterium]